MSKLLPQIFYKFEFSFTPRGPKGPHKLSGNNRDGEIDNEEPWHVNSAWFAIPNVGVHRPLVDV